MLSAVEVGIGFLETTISVSENAGIASIRIGRLDGSFRAPVQVEFSTIDGTATSLLPTPDFVPNSNVIIELDASNTFRFINITLLNDDVVESDEFFTGRLTTTDPRVLISMGHESVTVNILDDGMKQRRIV